MISLQQMEQMLERVRQGLPAIEKEQAAKKPPKVITPRSFDMGEPEIDNEPLPTGTMLMRTTGQIFKTFIKTMQIVTEEGTIQASKDGLRFVKMDPASIALIDFRIPSSSCERYFYEAEKPSIYTLNLREQFHGKNNIISNLKNADTVTLDIRTANPPDGPADKKKKRKRHDQQIIAKLTIDNSAGQKKDFALNLMDVRDNDVAVPKLEGFTVRAKLTTEPFIKALGDIQVVDNHATFEHQGNEKLILSAKGDGDEARIELLARGSELPELETTADTKVQFDADYIQDFLKAIKPIYGVISCQLKSKYPLKIEARYEKIQGFAEVDFYLAPMISDDPAVPTNKDEGPAPTSANNTTTEINKEAAADTAEPPLLPPDPRNFPDEVTEESASA